LYSPAEDQKAQKASEAGQEGKGASCPGAKAEAAVLLCLARFHFNQG
jgi:hypothetical protein